MMIHIPNVLTAEEVAHCRQVLEAAAWVDGRVTAGHQSTQVKRNLQLPEEGRESQQLGELVLRGLERTPLFTSAVLPARVFPPLFNRYEGTMAFGAHVDNALRTLPRGAGRLRTDVSATLFLSDPESYDGGELVVEDTYGSHEVKLPAGDLIVYPASSLHQVTAVTRGVRLASFFWIQSVVREDARRSLLFDLDLAIMELRRENPESRVLLSLTGTYHNLLRQWSEP